MAKFVWLLSVGGFSVAWKLLQRKHAWMFRYQWIALVAYIVLSFFVLIAMTGLLH